MSEFEIVVLPGDGIGVEVMEGALAVLDAVERRYGVKFARHQFEGGAAYYRDQGKTLEDGAFEACRNVGTILFGAMGLPDVRYADGTEIAPHLEMRREFGLYAGVRPVRRLPNTPSVLVDPRSADIDFVVIRESTEGLFYSHGKGVVENDERASETMMITRPVCEKLFDFSFKLAERRRLRRKRTPRVTCVDKSNVFVAMAFFRKIFLERAARFPNVPADCAYVDATALDLIRKPWEFDVLVMENMFGDIISDLAGGIVGGMGLAPCAEIGQEHALFQPAHGTAPDIAGTGVANPTAMLLSTAMMLDWLGQRHSSNALTEAAVALERAVDDAYADAIRPTEFGGKDGTREIVAAVIARLADAGRAA
jgi:3-isopropylmalate dehydrogenase